MPDGWEVYAESNPFFKDASPGQVQDFPEPQTEDDQLLLELLEPGIVSDPDQDGLPNNLEYWSGTVYEWMHMDINHFPNTKLVVRQPMIWDTLGGGFSSTRDDGEGTDVIIPPDFITDSAFEVSNGQTARTANPYVFYHTTRAVQSDTDGDGMDDFLEIYHGLNPLKGAADLMTIPLDTGVRPGGSGSKTGGLSVSNDFSGMPHLLFGETNTEFNTLSDVVAALGRGILGSLESHVGPFNFGLENVDADGDQLTNLEEYSHEAGPAGRAFHHTDPSPYLRTDIGTLPEVLLLTRPCVYSFTRENYTFDNRGFKTAWRWARDNQGLSLCF